MRSQYGSHPEDLAAAVGPSIGVCCYAVGEEVREQFAAAFKYGRELFREKLSADGATPGLSVDLWQANRRQLLDSGLAPERITVIGECTACTSLASGERKYFSHRADHGRAGRMLNAVGIV
jgi:purine-nucleoside/S-methyl-5'-thioadenosine phosphorylase / adenosine deaminase